MVRARRNIPPALLDLAVAQGGVLSGEQIHGMGLGPRSIDRLLRDGTWRSVGRGVHAVVPGPLDTDGQWWAALLLAGPGAALARHSAAQAWGLEPCSPGGRPVEVLLPVGRQRRHHAGVRALRTTVPFTVRGDPPRTTVERTVLDLVREDPSAAVGLLTAAVNSRRTSPARILDELACFERFPQRARVVGILDDAAGGAVSYLEVQYLRRVERAHHLPKAQRQSRSAMGLRDVLYGTLVVELDGRLGHTGVGAFRDMQRDNAHVMQGELTLRFGHADVERDPCAVAAMVARALEMTGQRVDAHPCSPDCPVGRPDGTRYM